MMTVYDIDGGNFSTLEGFYDEVTRVFGVPSNWGRNLDAFDDLLRGGFGTPNEGFTVKWNNSQLSRQRLGYAETARQLRLRLAHCHPSNRNSVSRELEKAEKGEGAAAFDWLVEIIRDHGPGGKQQHDRVQLLLE
jgi:RNAse (barnase) inhibitor barstar